MGETDGERRNGQVHFVGSLPFSRTEEAMRSCGALGDRVASLPDGEVGERKMWISYLAEQVYSKHPQLVETHAPDPEIFVAPSHEEGDTPPGTEEDAHWLFQVKPEVKDLEFDLGYQRYALESYEVFKGLRDEGAIDEGVAFQVSLPATMSAVDCYFEDPGQWPIVHAAYRDAIHADIERILDVIPAEDLVIQFDVCEEVVDLALGDKQYQPFYPQRTAQEKFAAHIEQLIALIDGVPENVRVGVHWCYGTWGGWPMVDMKDLRLCVDLSNAVVKGAGRRIDFVHMPAATSESGFYAALEDLDIGDTRVFLGIIHEDDGPEEFRQRMEAARGHLQDFGIAGVCGYGRSDPEAVSDIVGLHRRCAELLNA